MSKKILVIMDPIDSINVDKDSTYQLMLSAQDLEYELYYLIPGTLAIKSLEPVGKIAKINVFKNKDPFYNLFEEDYVSLLKFDYVLMRIDPPVDNNYIYKTHILDLIKDYNIKVVNPGSTLRNFNEKLITLNFPDSIPDTIVTCNKKDIEDFKNKYKRIILKPLNLMGGRSIYLLDESDKNLSVIFEDMTNFGQINFICPNCKRFL